MQSMELFGERLRIAQSKSAMETARMFTYDMAHIFDDKWKEVEQEVFTDWIEINGIYVKKRMRVTLEVEQYGIGDDIEG